MCLVCVCFENIIFTYPKHSTAHFPSWRLLCRDTRRTTPGHTVWCLPNVARHLANDLRRCWLYVARTTCDWAQHVTRTSPLRRTARTITGTCEHTRSDVHCSSVRKRRARVCARVCSPCTRGLSAWALSIRTKIEHKLCARGRAAFDTWTARTGTTTARNCRHCLSRFACAIFSCRCSRTFFTVCVSCACALV